MISLGPESKTILGHLALICHVWCWSADGPHLDVQGSHPSLLGFSALVSYFLIDTRWEPLALKPVAEVVSSTLKRLHFCWAQLSLEGSCTFAPSFSSPAVHVCVTMRLTVTKGGSRSNGLMLRPKLFPFHKFDAGNRETLEDGRAWTPSHHMK